MNRTAGSQGSRSLPGAGAPRGHLALRRRPRQGQRFADGRRFATGLRNARRSPCSRARAPSGPRSTGATSWATTGASPTEANAENPAEELVQVEDGDDFGWPYCYYSVDLRQEGAGARVRRRRPEGRPLRRGQGPGDRVPGALGPARPRVPQRRWIGRRVRRRAVRRLPRLLEPRADAAGGLPRRLRAFRRRQGRRGST